MLGARLRDPGNSRASVSDGRRTSWSESIDRMPPTFVTERLVLRPFTDDDVDELAGVFDDLEAMWDVIAIPGMPTDPKAIAARRIADSTAGWDNYDAGFWAVVIRADVLGPAGRIIGYCGFVNPEKGKVELDEDVALEVGWGMHPAYQRRGLATEAMTPVLDYAFNRRGCARLVAITDPRNLASRALTERLGFAFESEIRAYGTVQVRYVLERGAYLTHTHR